MKSLISKPALDRIQFEAEGHRYLLDGEVIPSVTQILEALGLIDTRYYQEWHAQRGQYVHRVCQYLDEGDLDKNNLDPFLLPYLQAYENFLHESGFKPELIEQIVFSENYRYAGTLDRTGFLNGCYILLDIKSGPICPWVALQTAGYELALANMGLKIPEKRFGLWLKPNGRYSLKRFEDPNDRNLFLGAVNLLHWKDKTA